MPPQHEKSTKTLSDENLRSSSSLSNLGLIQRQTHFEMQHLCLSGYVTQKIPAIALCPWYLAKNWCFSTFPESIIYIKKGAKSNSTLLKSTIFGHLGDISDSGLLFWIQASKAGKDKAKQRIFRQFFSRVLTKIYLQRAILQT